jgi:hypothetical protein
MTENKSGELKQEEEIEKAKSIVIGFLGIWIFGILCGVAGYWFFSHFTFSWR